MAHKMRKNAWRLALVAVLTVLVAFAVDATLRHSGDSTLQGSLCVGFDCAGNEPMGFSTVKLEENNLRINAADSSSTASFPTIDWQIEFNSSANGGGNYFKIRDCGSSGAAGGTTSTCGGTSHFTLESGADNDSIYVDSSGNQGGNVGFGTSTPAVDLHVLSGNTPTLRLHQDGSSGFTPQSWDLAGNESNFFIRDVTNGSKLPLRIEPNSSSNSIYVDNGGGVGFGTNAPSDGDGLAERFIDVRAGSSGDARVVADGGSENFAELLLQANNNNQWGVGHAGNVDDRFYVFNYPNNREDLSIAEATGVVSIPNGAFVQSGLTVLGGCGGCDAVFRPDWPLESIDEHAALMYANSYLPGVGPTGEGKVAIDVFEKTTGILQELEKAHIYIDQLHRRLATMEAAQSALVERLDAVAGPSR